MVRATQLVIHNLSDAEFGSAMETPVIVRVNLAARISPEHDIFPEAMDSKRLPVHVKGLADGIPHVLEAEFQFGFEFDWFFHSHITKFVVRPKKPSSKGLTHYENTKPPS